MRFAALILFALSLQAQTWTPITAGGTSILANGDQYTLLEDTTNHVLLYACHPTTASSIYSSAICAYNAATHNWSMPVANASTTQACGNQGSPWDAYIPSNGHLNGYWWIDNTAQKAYQTNHLCQNLFTGFTNVYQTNTQTMGANINVAPWGTGNGTFNATGHSYQTIRYIPSYGKSIFCCSDANATGIHVMEFNGSTWTDVSGSVTGTLPGNAGLLSAAYIFTDGTDLYVLAGCDGTTPGNFGGNICNGASGNGNDLFKYVPTTKVFSKLSPVGGIKPPTTFGSYPFAYYDTLRHQLVWYADTNKVWVYPLATNTWTEYTTTGGFTIPTSGTIGPNGNMAAYDSYNDVGVFMYPSGSISATPLVYHLNFPGSSLSIPLTIQEALYPGGSTGIARTDEPFCMGVPIALSSAITSTSTLGLTGATAGQFRILSTWDGTNAKWIEVCGIVASLSAGGTATVTLTNTGSGNFGGSNLATDNGTTITVATGAMTCTLKKANHNGCDIVDVGATHVVLTGTQDGFVVTGPAASGTSCGTCTTEYKSSNDASSTCSIENNGPVYASVKCSGAHKDGSGNAYTKFTNRYYLYKNKLWMKIDNIHRNADLATTNSFASAYKGHQGYEYRIKPNISGTLNFTFANHTGTPTTGTLATGGGTDEAHIYQAQNDIMKWQDWCSALVGCVTYTPDTGYIIEKNGSTLTSTSSTAASTASQGWANIENSSGVGVEIGVYQMAAYWPKSLEFNGGGTDVRIGIWARENSIPYYESWPQWRIHTLFVEYHATTPSSLPNDFLKFQHYLVGRAAYTQYNTAGVFPYPLLNSTTEDAYYTTVVNAASPAISTGNGCCIQDYGISSSAWPLDIYRFYRWPATGGYNDSESRVDGLREFITRGFTGRYLNAMHFERFQAESMTPHCDGCTWRSQSTSILDGFGQPAVTSANNTLATCGVGANGGVCGSLWHDQEHWWFTAMIMGYEMSGDETLHEALVSGGLKDWFLADASRYQNSGQLYNSRSIAGDIIGAVRYGRFLTETGDSDAANVIAQGVSVYTQQAAPVLCVSGFPSGCTPGGSGDQGVSRTRGIPWGAAGTSGSWCDVSHAYRVNSLFQASLFSKSLMELSALKGTAWSEYENSRHLAYGVSLWGLTEGYHSDGSYIWATAARGGLSTQGFRFGLALDQPSGCDINYLPYGGEDVWTHLWAPTVIYGTALDQRRFDVQLQTLMGGTGIGATNFGGEDIGYAIYNQLNPPTYSLQTITPTSFVDNGGGSYTLGWNVPAGAQSYTFKWAATPVVDGLLGFSDNSYITTDTARAGSSTTIQLATSASTVNNAYNGYVIDLQEGTGTGQIGTVSSYVGATRTATMTAPWSTAPDSSTVYTVANQGASISFSTDPATHTAWFAANNVSNEPTPSGSTQNYTFSTGTTGLVQANFSLKAMVPAGCYISPSSLPSGTVGASYGTQTLTANTCGAGTLTWTITSGALPGGLSGCNGVTGATCSISGTPTTAIGSPFSFTIHVTDGGSNSASLGYSVAVSGSSGGVGGSSSTGRVSFSGH